MLDFMFVCQCKPVVCLSVLSLCFILPPQPHQSLMLQGFKRSLASLPRLRACVTRRLKNAMRSSKEASRYAMLCRPTFRPGQVLSLSFPSLFLPSCFLEFGSDMLILFLQNLSQLQHRDLAVSLVEFLSKDHTFAAAAPNAEAMARESADADGAELYQWPEGSTDVLHIPTVALSAGALGFSHGFVVVSSVDIAQNIYLLYSCS